MAHDAFVSNQHDLAADAALEHFNKTTLMFLDQRYDIQFAPAKTVRLRRPSKVTFRDEDYIVEWIAADTTKMRSIVTRWQYDALKETLETLKTYVQTGIPHQGSYQVDVEAFYAMLHSRPRRTVGEVRNEALTSIARERYDEQVAKLPSAEPVCVEPSIEVVKTEVNDIWLFGTVDRCLSEMKYILDHPEEFDEATWQTFKHHVEDMDLFVKHAQGKMAKRKIASLPPVAVQRERGY